MKTMKPPPRRYSRAKTLLAPVVIPAALTALFAGPATANTTPAEKTHTLFMGADIPVEQNKEFRPVRAVSGSAFVIDVKGQPVTDPLTWNQSSAVSASLPRSTKARPLAEPPKCDSATSESRPNRFIPRVAGRCEVPAVRSAASNRTQKSRPIFPAPPPWANLKPINLEFKNVNQSQSVTVFEGAVRFKNTDAVEDYSAHVKTPVVKVA